VRTRQTSDKAGRQASPQQTPEPTSRPGAKELDGHCAHMCYRGNWCMVGKLTCEHEALHAQNHDV
jgi:hypothetical protein